MKFQIGKLSQEWAQKSQIPVWYEAVTTSTNGIAKQKSITDQAVSLFLTDHQTAGRGRGDHDWSDPESGGQALLSSWVFLLRTAPQPVLSPALGLAIWTALSASFPWLNLSLKAPNDLYLGERKLAGLLIENIQQGDHHRLILGLGLNVGKSPEHLPNSTCLVENLDFELGEEMWINVLDRLLLEISLSLSQTKNVLSDRQQKSLLHALNRFPGLELPYERVDKEGNLWRRDKKIDWSSL